ncbi:3-oxosteroid 1-dehydrogenase [Micromonospora pattaloongensis]|uniref:3-oxosteroid 1-dehydrogenase n=1 Tax=Micromonospora pattaloongensis TaxID=405436 RepID=A0A1H3QS79_9ACTN|nr:FAD-dependent oxidoreductase [Micromonospora pattaloongensis]SDZ16190.1 3-oxosteroid 1-dehydrogenase [Micromonospora pattaloongensis]
MTESWDREVDVLVVGTGAAGMTAAIAAADGGQRTLIVESTGKWGGTTALSGGGLWMPTHPAMAELGLEDSVDKALTYMAAAIGDAGPASSPERRRAFVETVPEVYRFLERLGVRWAVAKDYPDYYPDRPGGMVGRGIEAEPFDARRLDDRFATFRGRDSIPAPLKTDDVWLLSRAWSTPSGFVRGARFVFRTLGGLIRGKRLYGIGGGLTANLMAILMRQGVEVLLETPLRELVIDAAGGVTGAVVAGPDGRTIRIRAARGVVLAAGGFARNAEWRQRHHGVAGYSSAAEGDLGEPIRIAEAIGAQLSLMDDAWWGLSVPMPDGGSQFVLSERSMPFSVIVDSAGDRYMNESASYIDVGHAMLERHTSVPAIPSWLIVDARHRRRYLFNAFMQGTKKLRAAGTVRSADTIEELAAVLGMEPSRLRATVDRFNGFARAGVDSDFGRGRTAYDNYYGDPRVKPNPNLGPLEKGPFTAVQLVPGDLGTKGGLLTDADARVLDTGGTPIPGLYAAGNTTASVMGRTYPGPGSTIAPAVVFGYRAARHAAARTGTATGGSATDQA